MAKILVIDDHMAFRTVLSETISSLKHEVFEASCGKEALENIEFWNPDLIFLDLRMPDMDGIEVLKALRQRDSLKDVPIVILTAYADSTNTIEAIKLGAFEHLTKPVSKADLIEIIDKALTEKQNGGAEKNGVDLPPEDELIGGSAAFRKVEKLIGFALAAKTPVFIFGETGSGKEHIARALHKHSAHNKSTFEVVPCSNPESIFLKWNEYGTVFLDEIIDLSSSAQAKLLWLIQSNEKNPLIVSSSCQNVALAVKEKTFREELYYHLSAFPIYVPPLRRRGSDVLLLAETFLLRAAPERPKKLSTAAAKALLEYDWPGNVRELQNLIQRASVVSRGSTIEWQDLSFADSMPAPDISLADILQLDFHTATGRIEQMLLQKALKASAGNRTEAARSLGINRQLLYTKLKEHGIDYENS